MGALTARERIEARRASIAVNRSKGLKPYKFQAGTTSFRILPLSDDRTEPFERKYGKTYLKSFDGKSFFGIVDRSVTYDEPSDPFRELIFDAMRQAPDEETKKHYQSMLAGTRFVFNALILTDPNQSKTDPVIIEVSEGAFDTIMAQFMVWSEEDPDYDLAALDTGHVFTCEKTGTGLDTRYTFMATPKKAPLDKKILEKVIDIDEWIKSQVEGLEQKALAFLGQVNGSVGIATSTPTALIGASDAASSTATTKSNVSNAAVTTMIDEDDDDTPDAAPAEVIEDAVVEDVQAEPQLGVTADASSAEIDDILAQLDNL